MSVMLDRTRCNAIPRSLVFKLLSKKQSNNDLIFICARRVKKRPAASFHQQLSYSQGHYQVHRANQLNWKQNTYSDF